MQDEVGELNQDKRVLGDGGGINSLSSQLPGFLFILLTIISST